MGAIATRSTQQSSVSKLRTSSYKSWEAECLKFQLFYVCLYKKSSWELNRSQIFLKLRDSFLWCGIFHLWYHFSIKKMWIKLFLEFRFSLGLIHTWEAIIRLPRSSARLRLQNVKDHCYPTFNLQASMSQPLWILVIFLPKTRSVGSVSYPWTGDEVHMQVSPPLLLHFPIPGHDALRSSLLTLPGVAS